MSNADTNLLLGLAALQHGFLSRQQLVSSLDAWIRDPSKPLGQRLVEAGHISREQYAKLGQSLEEQAAGCGEDTQQVLETIHGDQAIRDELHTIIEENQPSETVDYKRSATDGTRIPNGSSPASSPSSTSRYTILRTHAKGGLGEVCVARDQELNRNVALKQIHQRYADEHDSRTRFELEAEITGGLEHPSIVPVYGFGKHADGRPYYAMRFIRGKSLKEATRNYHNLPRGKRHVELQKLLRHFIDACHAVDYAHGRGVLHRDIKPDNVMLGDYGETLVVDWGLAKPESRPAHFSIDESTMLRPMSASGTMDTLHGSFVGTPGYASPEQSAGKLEDLAAASDIFSLGATLYFVLTNQHPFPGKSVQEISEKVRAGRCPAPRSLDRTIAKPLNAICMKAMATEPAARYASAADLVGDMEHWLADESVVAYHETGFERVSRWARRHKAWVRAGIGTISAIALVALVAATLINQARQAERIAKERAREAQQQAEYTKDLAIQRLKDARGAVNAWLITPAADLQGYPGVDDFRKYLLRLAADDYAKFADTPTDSAEIELERGRTLLRLGDFYLELSEIAEAESSYKSAMAVFQLLQPTRETGKDITIELANSEIRLGKLKYELGDHEEAKRFFMAASRRAAELLHVFPSDWRLHDIAGVGRLNAGLSSYALGHDARAEEFIRQAIPSLRLAVENVSDQNADQRRRQLAKVISARRALGNLLVHTSRWTEAEALFNDVIAKAESLNAGNSGRLMNQSLLADSRLFLASLYRRQGRWLDELSQTRKATLAYTVLAEAFPERKTIQESLARTNMERGQVQFLLGRPRQAAAALRDAIPVLEELALEQPFIPRYREEWATAQSVLAQILDATGQTEKAADLNQRAIELLAELTGDLPAIHQYRHRLALAESQLSVSQSKLGLETAKRHFQNAVSILTLLVQDIQNASSGRNRTTYLNDLATVYARQAEVLEHDGQTVRARDLANNAQRIWNTIVSDSAAPSVIHDYARFVVDSPQWKLLPKKKAIELARRAQEQAPRNPDFCATRGAAFYRGADYAKSIAWMSNAVENRGKGNARDLFYQAMAAARQGNISDAKSSLQQGRQSLEANAPGNLTLRRLQSEATSLVESASDSQAESR